MAVLLYGLGSLVSNKVVIAIGMYIDNGNDNAIGNWTIIVLK